MTLRLAVVIGAASLCCAGLLLTLGSIAMSIWFSNSHGAIFRSVVFALFVVAGLHVILENYGIGRRPENSRQTRFENCPPIVARATLVVLVISVASFFLTILVMEIGWIGTSRGEPLLLYIFSISLGSGIFGRSLSMYLLEKRASNAE